MRLRLLWFTLPMLAGCGGNEVKDVGVQELVLESLVTRPSNRVAARIDVPADATAWSVEAPEVRTEEVGGSRALTLQGGRGHSLAIPIVDPTEDWNLARIEVIARTPLSLRAGLARSEPGSANERTPPRYTGVQRGEVGENALLFDLGKRASGAALEKLALIAYGTPDEDLDWSLLGIELLDRPPELGLPSPEEGPRPVVVAGQSRSAVGLSARTPLAVGLRVELGMVLDVAWAPMERTEAPPGVVLRVGPWVDGTVRPLLERPLAPGGWTDARLDLEGLAGQEVRLGFELAGERAGDALVAVAMPRAYVPGPEPTVLLITSDTHRADHMGAARDDVGVKTPTLDALARSGVLFEDCISGSGVTIPSHAALMVGQTPRGTGVINNYSALPRSATTLAECFSDAGWATFAATSTSLLSDEWSGLGQGFERLDAPTALSRPGEETVANFERWIDSAAGRPLFAWVHLYDAHRPYLPPREYVDLYYPAGRDPEDPARELGAPAVPGLPHVRDREFVFASYRGEISLVDSLVERLLSYERLASGIVVFTADHGECLGDQGIWWEHLAAYPAVLRVPLILRWPGGPANVVVEDGVHHQDLARTLLDLSGIEREFPGRDLRAWLDPESRPARPIPRFGLSNQACDVSLALGRWFLTVHLEDDHQNHLRTRRLLDHPVELFDLETDPGCTTDRSAGEPEVMARMAAEMLAWAEATPVARAQSSTEVGPGGNSIAELGYGSVESADPDVEFLDLELLRERLSPWLE